MLIEARYSLFAGVVLAAVAVVSLVSRSAGAQPSSDGDADSGDDVESPGATEDGADDSPQTELPAQPEGADEPGDSDSEVEDTAEEDTAGETPGEERDALPEEDGAPEESTEKQ